MNTDLLNPYLPDALIQLRPTAIFEIIHGDNPRLNWQSVDTPPSDAEIDAKVVELEAAANAVAYRGHREDQYPPLEDFVDAYYWAQKGDNSLLDAYVSKVDAVKAKYPKPSN